MMPTMTTYSQRAPFYNAISSTIHFSAIPTLFIEGITSELLVNRGAARRDEEPVRPCTIGFGCVRHASRDCEADREWPADHRQSASGSRSRSQGENSGLFHAPYVTPEGTHGRVSVSCGDGWQRVNSADEVKPWFLRDSPGFHLIPELNPPPSEAIFDKITMSAFEGTPLNIARCAIAALMRLPSSASPWKSVLNLQCGMVLILVTSPWLSKMPVVSAIVMPPPVQLPASNSRAMLCSRTRIHSVLSLGA